MTAETDHLREMAERCMRLARSAIDPEVALKFRELAAEHFTKAAELEAKPVAQTQQQQPQPKKEE